MRMTEHFFMLPITCSTFLKHENEYDGSLAKGRLMNGFREFLTNGSLLMESGSKPLNTQSHKMRAGSVSILTFASSD